MMKINYDILKNLIRCNKGMKLEFRDNTNVLDISINHVIILSIELKNNSIEENSELIYSSIVSLDNITLYVPKIYMK
ncbi:hypothetical protein [Romboutsia sp.]|uniref:hypothetical protein n=1 Tax=Romboutsia sp. TaxID=1965302 RepID=UPI003F6782E6